MSRIKVAAGTLNQTPLAWEQNKQNILAAIAEAKQRNVSVLCLPELCIPGYGCEDMFLSAGVQATCLDVLEEIRPATAGIVVSVGLPLRVEGKLFNVACLLVNGEIAGFVGKRFLAREGIHYEPRWFSAWPEGQRLTITIRGNKYPCGDIFFACGDVRIGFEICEDAWVAERPGEKLACSGVNLLLNPSASHFAFHKAVAQKKLVSDGSQKFQAVYVYANLLGNEAGRAIYDGCRYIAENGEIVANGERFSFADFAVTSAIVNILPKRSSGDEIDVNFNLSWRGSEGDRRDLARRSVPAWELSEQIKEEEFSHAVSLALFDYLRKSHSNGFVLSLSGGVDSTSIACLIWLMVEFGVTELGLKKFQEKLVCVNGIAAAKTNADLVKCLLTCVYQATRNSSDTTRKAARGVAQAVGAEFYELNVDGLVQEYVSLVSEATQQKLTWEKHDIALQNIQARVRNPSVWLIANMKGALLLATSNRSEAAVGYTTMDGDTAGSLSPIAGAGKTFLIRWLSWMEKTGPVGARPIPALSLVTVQQPTAELRPLERAQTDEADLMPYAVLDAIEGYAIRDKLLPAEVLEKITKDFSQYSGEQLMTWTKRFFTLWCRNQWKRERYAASFHLDDRNLDPKTWCRFPILSGGFERELAALKVR